MIKKLLYVAFFCMATTTLSAQTKDIALAEISETTPPLRSDHVSIFPNPAINQIKISNNSSVALKVSIYNILGDVMIARELTDLSVDIDISNLPSGIYIVAFANGDQVITQRLVKE